MIINIFKYHATSSQAPPIALILLSAVLLNYLAFTITGTPGNLPLPRTLKYPAFVTSITGSFPALFGLL